MQTIQLNGISYVTARQLEIQHSISRRKCWDILHKASAAIRTQRLGNMYFYAVEDTRELFRGVAPSYPTK